MIIYAEGTVFTLQIGVELSVEVHLTDRKHNHANILV